MWRYAGRWGVRTRGVVACGFCTTVVFVTTSTVGVLLDPAPDFVRDLRAGFDDMERVLDRDRVG